MHHDEPLAIIIIAILGVAILGIFASNGTEGNRITGFQIATGTANLTVETIAVLTIVDSIINFGVCTPPAVGLVNITSNSSSGGGYCDGVFPNFVYLRNDGNQNLNVTIKTNVSAAVFLGNAPSNNTAFYYMTAQSLSANAGCVNNVDACPTGDCNTRADSTNYTLQVNWTNISANEFVEFKACHNLTFGGGVERNFTVYARIDIPDDLAGSLDRRAALNFTGYVIT